MSLTTIQKEIPSLAPEEQDKLTEQLTMLRLQREDGYVDSLDQALNNIPSDEWVLLEDLKNKLVK
jgi:hypothetical protein